MDHHPASVCLVCGKFLPPEELIPGAAILPPMAKLVRRDHPRFTDQTSICAADFAKFRNEYLKMGMSDMLGILPDLSGNVLGPPGANGNGKASATDPAVADEEPVNALAARLARISMRNAGWMLAVALGLIGVAVGLVAMRWNTLGRSLESLPIHLVTLALAALAAIQAPVVLLCLRQGSGREHRKADLDNQRALKAELAERQLEEKVDHLLNLVARQTQVLVPDGSEPGDEGADNGIGGYRPGRGRGATTSSEPPPRPEQPRRLKLVP